MTNFMRSTSLRRILATSALLSLLAAGVAGAATITIFNNDGAGEGFNDPTARAPIGGNPGLTIGQQRLNLFTHAAGIWGGILPSTVPIVVTSQFNPQTCNATSGVLGSAGPISILRDFGGAEFAGTWYYPALANRLNGTDLLPAQNDINATFNSNLDLATCLGGVGWYYGFDGLEGTAVELLPVLLHEMGHGLGFSTQTSGTTGNFNGGFPTVFDRFLFDPISGGHWNTMTAAQRVTSAISGQLAWDGPTADAEAASFLAGRQQMVVSAPAGIAGTYVSNVAAFGPQTFNVAGNVVLIQDAGGTSTTDACEALTNAAAIAGNIALVDRGTCTFVSKAAAIQAAGATAIIIANNAAGALAPGGADPTIVIPVVGISLADGNTLKANLGAGVTLTLNQHPTLRAGADNSGRPLMFTPNPFQSGSSVSHWDVSLTPNALMEPAINNNLHDTVDLTHGAFDDIGWFGRVVATTLSMFAAEGRGDGILVRWQFGDMSEVAAITLQRAPAVDGPWAPIASEVTVQGANGTALDRSVEPNVNYYYRLSLTDRQGNVENVGMATASRIGREYGDLFLGLPSPNPASHGTSFSFRIGRPEFVRLAVVDAGGRQVRTLQNAMMPAGDHTRAWDGLSEGGDRVAPGVYFINLRTSSGVRTTRVAVMN